MPLKKILIIHTGGTIGMFPTDHGYAPSKEDFHRVLASIPELSAPSVPAWDLIDMDPLLDSSNISVNEWNKIGALIAENYNSYDGFVVLHGTDTMAYTASALSFMLRNNARPVILTGSQIPLCEIRNDARDNLLTSLLIAADDRVHEVCLYFGGKLLRGNRAMKYSADDLIAFESPNYPALAEAGIEIRYNTELLMPPCSGRFSLQLLENVPIGVIKIFPGIQFELFDAVMTEKLKGIVIETFGAGNIPGNEKALLPIIRKATENGTVMVICSQCPHGTVTLGAYEASATLKNAGAVSGYDLTTEAAVAKLYYLFSRGLSGEEIKSRMERSLRGEVTTKQTKADPESANV
uniref:asparaginase n=1 Tax=uncultured bacterium Contigcl_23 TaxID=1393667 RepID=W0FQ48_9BACT|nr:L-asparaginase type I family protein [uncultured bacterium Contigcl_23]